MPWYRGRPILKELQRTFSQDRRKTEGTRFIVQDIYPYAGSSIAAGILLSGSLRRGNQLVNSATGKPCRVKMIREFTQEVSFSRYPKNIGVVFEGRPFIQRGQVLYQGCDPLISKRIEAKIFCLKPALPGEQFQLQSLTQEILVTLQSLKKINDFDFAGVSLEGKQSITLERPEAFFRMSRFVLRDSTGEIAAIGAIQ